MKMEKKSSFTVSAATSEKQNCVMYIYITLLIEKKNYKKKLKKNETNKQTKWRKCKRNIDKSLM